MKSQIINICLYDQTSNLITEIVSLRNFTTNFQVCTLILLIERKTKIGPQFSHTRYVAPFGNRFFLLFLLKFVFLFVFLTAWHHRREKTANICIQTPPVSASDAKNYFYHFFPTLCAFKVTLIITAIRRTNFYCSTFLETYSECVVCLFYQQQPKIASQTTHKNCYL